MTWTLESLLTGKIARLTEAGEMSAINKTGAIGPRTVHLLGIEGDAQADLSVHGGPDKAIHHYPRDHYEWWVERIGAHPLLARAGAFGENLSTRGLTEHDVCIGDRFRLGSALVEIAQGRQPCWKQAHRLDDNGIVALMVKSGRTGWYYRVIEEGSVAAGDALVAVSRLHPQWSVARTTALVVAGIGTHEEACELASLKELAKGWRERAIRLAGNR
jgi:MOSC domain-containing protein YiiM